jgi:hypothetical protein
MSIAISDRLVACTQGSKMVLFVYDLMTQQIQQIPVAGAEDVRVSGNFVIWRETASETIFGFDASLQGAFQISLPSIDPTSLLVNGQYVAWKFMGQFCAYDLLARQRIFTGMKANDNNYFLSGDYLIYLANWSFDLSRLLLHGYDLHTRQVFDLLLPAEGMLTSLEINGNYVFWSAYTIDISNILSISRIWRLANDQCSDAVEVKAGIPYMGNSSGAIGEDMSSCGSEDARDVWHMFTPTSGGQYTIDASSQSFDTVLSVSNTCEGESLACNDDRSLDSTNSRVSLSMVKGKLYLIRVAGVNQQSGPYEVLITTGVCKESLDADLNGDCKVDLSDLSIFSSQWMRCNLDPTSQCRK